MCTQISQKLFFFFYINIHNLSSKTKTCLHKMQCRSGSGSKPLAVKSSDTPRWLRCRPSILRLHPTRKQRKVWFWLHPINSDTNLKKGSSLSPSPSLCDPAKKERVRTNGLSEPPERDIRPSAVAMCCESSQ